jgi:predicted MFS family arabinose efflux permease
MNRRLTPAWTLAILTGLNLLNYVDRFVLAAVLPPLKADLHLDDGQAGRIATAFMIGYFATSPVFGYLGDRFPRKWLIAIGIFIWSAGTVLTGLAQTFVVLLLFRVLVGTGEASYATMSPSLISDTHQGERRNMALTIFYVAIPIGAALGTILGGQIAAHYTWRHAFIWAGAPGLLLALVLLPFKEPTRGGAQETAAHAAKPGLADVLRLFAIPDFMLVTLGYTAYTFGMGAFGTWGPTFFVRAHNMSLTKADSFFGASLVVTGLLGTFIGGWLAGFWHKRNPAGYALTLGLSVAVAVPLAVLAFTLPNPTTAQACLVGAMFFLWFSTGPVNTVILDSVPVNLHASAMAVSIFMIHLFGDMWSSEIVGHLSDHWQSLQKAVLILPVALFVAAVLWLWLAARAARTGAAPVHAS